MEKILKDAILHYGTLSQKIIAIEEMSELIKELTKDLREDTGMDISHIAEETADVEIMLEQIKLIYNIQEKVQEHKQKKIKRLEKRIEGEQNA